MEYWKKRGCFLIGFMFLISCGIYGFLSVEISIWIRRGVSFCLLDCLTMLTRPQYFGMLYLPVAAGMILSERTCYLQSSFVVRYKSAEQIFKIMFTNTFRKSFVLALIYSLLCCFLSSLCVTELSNWDQMQSFYFMENQVLFTGNAWLVLGTFFLFNIMKTFLVVITILLSEIFLSGIIAGVLFWTVVMILEWCFTKLTVFFNLFCTAPSQFAENGKPAVLLGCLILLYLVLYGIGKWLWKRKEYYD